MRTPKMTALVQAQLDVGAAVAHMVGRPVAALPGPTPPDVDPVVEIDAGQYTFICEASLPLRVRSMIAVCRRCGHRTFTGYRPTSVDAYNQVVAAMRPETVTARRKRERIRALLARTACQH